MIINPVSYVLCSLSPSASACCNTILVIQTLAIFLKENMTIYYAPYCEIILCPLVFETISALVVEVDLHGVETFSGF